MYCGFEPSSQFKRQKIGASHPMSMENEIEYQTELIDSCLSRLPAAVLISGFLKKVA